MPSRDFIDSAGERWLVWETRPTTRVRLDPAFETGWLTFESGHRLRRLAPTPPDWAALDQSELERLCDRATPVARRRTPPSAMDATLDTPPTRRDELRS